MNESGIGKRQIYQTITIMIAFIGLILLMKSVRIGQYIADAYLRSHGGSMNSDDFRIILENDIATYRWLGGILLLLGGFYALRSFVVQDNTDTV